jgi:chromatin structure-remodeling complex subunit RSC9
MSLCLGLRQAPPQRVLYQPDLSSTRQSRNAANHPQPSQNMTGTTSAGQAYNMSSNSSSNSFKIENYEPRPQIPLTLRPVLTPASNPTLFKEKVKRIRDAHIARTGRSSLLSYQGMMLPGSKQPFSYQASSFDRPRFVPRIKLSFPFYLGNLLT